MTYAILKKTPAANWYAIHKKMDLESALYFLECIKDNYESDSDCSDVSLFDDGRKLQAQDGGDWIEYKITEE